MPRIARNIYGNSYYHIIARGNNKQTLFFSPDDFMFYINLLGKFKSEFQVNIMHYCLMSNHIHLLVKNDSISSGISQMMHHVQTSFSLRYKSQQNYTGHIFEGRYKHFHIDSDAYLLECGRYIELNPVRAKMVTKPEDYPWSSFRFYSEQAPLKILTANPLYQGLSTEEEKRKSLYSVYVKQPRENENYLDKKITRFCPG